MPHAPTKLTTIEANPFEALKTLPRRFALALIRFYQRAISPLAPPACRFHPTCSHYTYEAIERFGLWHGVLLGLMRLCKCHPLHRGGVDMVPESFRCTICFKPQKVRLNSAADGDTPDGEDDVT